MANHSDLQEEIWYNRFPRPLPGAASPIGMQHKNVFKHFYGILVSAWRYLLLLFFELASSIMPATV